MPKPTKLHSKGKAKTIQKPCKVESCSDSVDPEESMRQFQLELCWCVQQLERSLTDKKGNEKQMQEAWKVLTILKNNNQPIIRKRQLMRTHFGDYRAKMAAEEKKLVKLASKIKISDTPQQPKATFVRKSAFQTTGDNSFRFNFKPPEEDTVASAGEHKATEREPIASLKTIEKTETIKKPQTVEETQTIEKKDGKNFKFTFTENEFKFNFSLDSNS